MTRTKIVRHLVIPAAVSTLILVLLTRLASWQDFLSLLHHLRWDWMAVGGAAYCAEVVFMGLRASVLFASEEVPGGPVILVSGVHNFINKVLPARIGELAFPLLMRRYLKVDGKRAFSVLVLTRLADFYVIAVAFSVVYTLQRDLLSRWKLYWLPVALVWLWLIVIPLVLLREGFWTPWLSHLERVPLPGPVDRARGFLFSLWCDLRAVLRPGVRLQALARVMLFSVLVWLLLYCVFVALGRAMGLDLTLGQLLFGATIAIFGTILPIGGVGHFGGLETGWTLALLMVGASRSEAVATAIVISVATTLFALSIAMSSVIILELHLRRSSRYLS